MKKLISWTGTEMWVADDRVNEYLGQGCTLPLDTKKPENEVPVKKAEPKVETIKAEPKVEPKKKPIKKR